ncbi:GNAT family N-acetyltransferase [Klugiella xanthotipulae]|uniref:N-acetyltransferase domain-containing protein n=1 Tax=Klugiella xanthotipulae TaxID=244735 RepID=A0A543HSS0_9MICO|nr:GNAT family N-acetyltransferase [Klugiella xanthotipulae]TQM61382.1 hypothetical protein FB466_2333 [Klugiella xanthotipulae]
MTITTLTAEMVPAITAINNAAYPAVPLSSEGEIAHLVNLSERPLAVWEEESGRVVGFALALAEGLNYESENYRWFSEYADRFIYLDRIVLATEAQNKGLGAQLYGRIFAWATERNAPSVFCEVNLDPPNPGSLAFHHRLGFTSVGELSTKADTVRVSLLQRTLGSAS